MPHTSHRAPGAAPLQARSRSPGRSHPSGLALPEPRGGDCPRCRPPLGDAEAEQAVHRALQSRAHLERAPRVLHGARQAARPPHEAPQAARERRVVGPGVLAPAEEPWQEVRPTQHLEQEDAGGPHIGLRCIKVRKHQGHDLRCHKLQHPHMLARRVSIAGITEVNEDSHEWVWVHGDILLVDVAECACHVLEHPPRERNGEDLTLHHLLPLHQVPLTHVVQEQHDQVVGLPSLIHAHHVRVVQLLKDLGLPQEACRSLCSFLERAGLVGHFQGKFPVCRLALHQEHATVDPRVQLFFGPQVPRPIGPRRPLPPLDAPGPPELWPG
mmetsp:Transcript_77264/g.213720  ORF Transcript_77264/g.213720 Transcript_77264/m.213720 type:complete len:326 (+) Transcript_77264:189-1166(+)